MKNVIFAILALVVLMACQVPEVEEVEPEAQTIFDSLEACEAAGVECVAESTYFGPTGRYFVLGKVMEGQHVSLVFDQKPEDVCEEGMIAVHDLPMKDDGCLIPMCACYVCTKCGNGECGLGEDKCNCPQDCLEDKSPVWTDAGDGRWQVHDPSCGSVADMNCVRTCFEKGEVKLSTGLRMNVWEDCAWSEDVYEIKETSSGKEVLCFRPRCVPNTGVDADNRLITDCRLSCE